MLTVCPVKCREVTVKKKRVETFRNIRYGDGRIYNWASGSELRLGSPVYMYIYGTTDRIWYDRPDTVYF